MENLVLIGIGGHATACIDVIRSTKRFNVLGYINKHEVLNNTFGLDYLGDDQCSFAFIPDVSFLIAVGQLGEGTIREQLYSALKIQGARFPLITSPYAYVSDHARIGEGTIIMHGAVIQAGAVVGENCIINDRALLEHDTIVGNNSHISTGAILNGQVSIGDRCFIGSGAIVKNNVNIYQSATVGAGSVVLSNVGSHQIVVGNPGRIL